MNLEPLPIIDSAAAYAGKAGREVVESEQPGNPDPHWHLMRAQVYATLAQAAATLEAARLMGPTPEDQARLNRIAPWAIADPDNCPAVTRAESEMWDRHI